MNLQTIIDNYDKIDKSVRIFTFLYFFVFSLLVSNAALNIIELDEPILYTYDIDYGMESIIDHGEFAIIGCVALLPVIFIMPFDRFNGQYGFVKMFVYVIDVGLSTHFIAGDASYFEEFGFAIENAAFMNQHLDSVLCLFIAVCVTIPIISRYVEQLKTTRRLNVK